MNLSLQAVENTKYCRFITDEDRKYRLMNFFKNQHNVDVYTVLSMYLALEQQPLANEIIIKPIKKMPYFMRMILEKYVSVGIKRHTSGLTLAYFYKEENNEKVMLLALPFVAAACSAPEQQSTVPMDMQAVAEYQQRVASGNTVSEKQKQRVAQQIEPDEPLNQSDKRPKVVRQVVREPVIYPSIGIGYGYHRHRHHW
ncbi:Uncharacterised protein [Actinobacillus equuli]|nr:Uncharacterised protein [Actinobacillus equuli]